MKRYTIISLIILIIATWSCDVFAFWGSDKQEIASGLNVATGFDINTVATFAGKVLTVPERRGQEEHAVMSVNTSQGVLTVLLGPWWYWERQSVTISKGQDVVVIGSRAQGKDGSLYLFAQSIENISNKEKITLRSETGAPGWSRGIAGSQSGGGMSGNSGASSRGAGNRGSGMRGGRR